MTILVFGKAGQVGSVLNTADRTLCLDRDEADLSDPPACAQAILDTKPRAVINAAAYTAVDKAETEENVAALINADAPAAMAKACAMLGIPFVSISTDYVFDGSGKSAWRPQDRPAPLNAYGRTKLAGELAIEHAGGTWAMLRTSWVFSPGGKNFVHTMLRLGVERDRLSIVDDQIGGPTPGAAIAQACLIMAERLIAKPQLSGVYHLAGAPDVSWAGFAKAIFETAGLACDVQGIPTSDYPTPAQRPLNSRLNCDSLEQAFGITRPDWASYLPAMIKAQERITS